MRTFLPCTSNKFCGGDSGLPLVQHGKVPVEHVWELLEVEE